MTVINIKRKWIYENRSLELTDKGETHTDNTQAKAGLSFNLPSLILNHACQRERLQPEKQADGRSVLQGDTIPTAEINKGWSGPTPFSITPVTITCFSFLPGFHPAPINLNLFVWQKELGELANVLPNFTVC